MFSSHLLLLVLGCLVLAGLLSWYAIPPLVHMAYRKRILDVPNGRKLQRMPVPVVGGMAVMMAVLAVVLLANFFVPMRNMLIPVGCLLLMFFIGIFDDMMGVSYRLKFVFQLLVVFMLWYFGYRLDNLCGIFGMGRMGLIPSLLISMVAGVGLMNAMNLIDGVDGLSSSLGILTGLVCTLSFLLHGDAVWAVVSVSFVGALVPFFVFNVFSRKYKMFIGDSGTLVLGLLAYICTCRVIHQPVLYNLDLYRVSMMLAIYAVPVFDTLRVMAGRMMAGKSPFLPDKTHLHHIFVSMRFPHVTTTVVVVGIAVVVGLLWLASAAIGMSVTAQAVFTAAVACAVVWGVYMFLSAQRRSQSPRYVHMVAGSRRQARAVRAWMRRVQSAVDRKSYPPPAPSEAPDKS